MGNGQKEQGKEWEYDIQKVRDGDKVEGGKEIMKMGSMEGNDKIRE